MCTVKNSSRGRRDLRVKRIAKKGGQSSVGESSTGGQISSEGREAFRIDRTAARGAELYSGQSSRESFMSGQVVGGKLYSQTEKPRRERNLYAWTKHQRREGEIYSFLLYIC